MKASELRIGNLVELHKQHIEVGWHIISEVYQGVDQYKPIPLTEEWLLKFGFEEYEGYDFGISVNKVPRFEKNDISIMLSGGAFWYATRQYDGGTSDPYEAFRDVQHVHQLQNLYFALTGTELEITHNEINNQNKENT